MKEIAVKTLNIEKEVSDVFIAIVFHKSTALSYGLAVNMAKQAHRYMEGHIGNRLVHCAMFNRTPENASLAVSIIEEIGTLKGVQVWVLGKTVANPFNVSNVLKCYYTSLLCDDYLAHCVVYHQEDYRSGDLTMRFSVSPGEGQKKQNISGYHIPCRLIDNTYGHSGLYESLPASLEDQIQAIAVSKGCYWCPHFDKHNFKKL